MIIVVAHWGKHRTEVTEATEGGIGVGAKTARGGHHGLRGRNTRTGKSIAQRSRRPQRGELGLGAKIARGGHHGLRARNTRHREKHRTEVTEFTEGGIGYWGRGPKLLAGDITGLRARKKTLLTVVPLGPCVIRCSVRAMLFPQKTFGLFREDELKN